KKGVEATLDAADRSVGATSVVVAQALSLPPRPSCRGGLGFSTQPAGVLSRETVYRQAPLPSVAAQQGRRTAPDGTVRDRTVSRKHVRSQGSQGFRAATAGSGCQGLRGPPH